MIIEGLVTCGTAQGEPHVAALGPVVSSDLSQWTLRPFQSSRIFTQLREHNRCVFHTLDDALPIVQLVLGLQTELVFQPLGDDWLIASACHWYQLEIVSWNVQQLRSEATARMIAHGDLRPFWGWNRAKHALLEAAILISRASMVTAEGLRSDLERLRSPIEKTAGPNELAAWKLIEAKFL